jgi:hypothetical protein
MAGNRIAAAAAACGAVGLSCSMVQGSRGNGQSNGILYKPTNSTCVPELQVHIAESAAGYTRTGEAMAGRDAWRLFAGPPQHEGLTAVGAAHTR